MSLHMLWLMCFQVNFKPSHSYERELESSAKTKASTPLHNSSIAVAPSNSPTLVLSSLIFCLPKGEKVVWEGLYFTQVSVFGDSCQRGRKYWPKAKGTHHHPNFKINDFQMVNFKIVSLCVLKGEKVAPFKFDILKPSWTLRGELIEGEFCF